MIWKDVICLCRIVAALGDLISREGVRGSEGIEGGSDGAEEADG